jgi:hypothetical protein
VGDPHRNRVAHGYPHTHAQPHPDANFYSYRHGDVNANTHSVDHAHPNPDADPNLHRNGHRVADRYADDAPHSDNYGNRNSDDHIDPHASAYSNVDGCATAAILTTDSQTKHVKVSSSCLCISSSCCHFSCSPVILRKQESIRMVSPSFLRKQESNL